MNASKEVYCVNLIFDFLWVIIALLIFFVGKKSAKFQQLRANMIAMWKYSLAIAIVSYICSILGNGNFLNLQPVFLFFQCLVGFAIAKSIIGYEPLPVVKAFEEHKNRWRQLLLMLIYGVIITIVMVIIVLVLHPLIPHVGEVNNTSNALPQNNWLLFFTLFNGAGITEETVYRLIFLSLFWKLTNHKWVAIILSALLFGVYHLTPLNSLYMTYWSFPIYQFVFATVSGIVFGFLYTKRGYENAVVGHTFSDWLPILISSLMFMK